MASYVRGLFLTFLITLMQPGNCQEPKWLPMLRNTKPELLKPDKGEISIEQALESCQKFLKLIGHQKPKDIPRINRSDWGGGRRGTIYIISYGADCKFSVDIATGKVVSYKNSKREFEMHKGLRSKLPARYRTLLDAQMRFHALAKKLAIPESHSLVNIKITGGGDPRTTESPGRRVAQAAFEDYPYGYPLERKWNGYGIQFDITDGALVYFTYVRDPGRTIETKKPRLTYEQAKSKAEPIATKYAAGKYEPGEAEYKLGYKIRPSDRPSELSYVCPNGRMGGVMYDLNAKPQRLRLAWVLRYPRSDAIWIDAVDGRLLGGQNHRGR